MLDHRLHGLARRAVGTDIRHDGHGQLAPGIGDIHMLTGIELAVHAHETAAQPLGLEPRRPVGTGHADNRAVMHADAHVGHAGQDVSDGAAVGIDHPRIRTGGDLAQIAADKGVSEGDVGQVFQGLPADEILGESGLIGVERQGEGPGVVDEGPVPDILMGKGQHRAGPQAVAGSQAACPHAECLAGGQQVVPQGLEAVRGKENLEAELAGVAGPRQEDGRSVGQADGIGPWRGRIPVALEREIGHVAQDRSRVSQQRRQHLGGGRPLHIHLAQPVREIVDHDIPSALMATEMIGHRGPHAGIDHHHVVARGQQENDGIIDGAAVLIQKRPVDATPR
ncbi:hypothetical protein DESC_740136 [Desulfosarcina cetonica]|nr:hypothetical protein DESC_740136 [Desulfosarcina cetonica]